MGKLICDAACLMLVYMQISCTNEAGNNDVVAWVLTGPQWLIIPTRHIELEY